MICIEIDELVPCLTDNETGEIVETEVIRIKRKSFLSKYNERTKWYINWAELLKQNEIYAIVLKGTVAIQGLVAIRSDADMQAVFVSWMVATPQNFSRSDMHASSVSDIYSGGRRLKNHGGIYL